ncbi:uncharacterized protein LOC130763940 [Actinidia eriantha]|uniref:uncharacterized protein LOC130763940 n=1 Tax=Actinidia eriantha TaxID=165200 RepID=UPI0025911A7F|nr:uncharacterized protein LOC130763940 [Actinidia eriantha]
MVDTKGDQTEKPQHQQSQHLSSSPSPKDPSEESPETRPPPPPPQHHHQPASATARFLSPTLYIPIDLPPPPPLQQFEAVNPKRPRYTSAQWKPLPAPSQQPQINIRSTESSPTTAGPQAQQPNPTAAGSSSEKTSSPSPSFQNTTKPDGEDPYHHPQLRKGKYVSPVWKPSEMLWLARAWRVQYHGGDAVDPPTSRGKTRSDKDREVAEFLNRHGVSRDAKTAGTKWDNMLGEFRKVYEWERGGDSEQVGKSYFRLSPYERKLHRLPASFDEEVFEELAQFMGSRMRTPQSKAAVVAGDDSWSPLVAVKALPPPLSHSLLHKLELFTSLDLAGRAKLLVMTTGGEPYLARGTLLGFESSSIDVSAPSSSTSSKEFRRIGRVRMVWEESVSLWAEEGEQHRGRVKLEGLSFLKADELTFLDDSMVACTMEAFEDGPLKGFSVDRFVSGQQIKVFGRRKSSSVPAASGTCTFFYERAQLPASEPSIRSMPPWEFQDPTEYYVGCLQVPPPSLPGLFELSWHLQEPPPEELRFPLRKDVYRDLPQGKELFFTTASEVLDCRGITFDLLCPIVRSNPSLTGRTASSRDSFIGLWDDCINRIISKFSSIEMIIIRKPTLSSSESLQDQWPNVTGFLRNFCLWRGEECDQLREGHLNPLSSIVEKLFWSFTDLPYVLGYYAVGYIVTFCALSRSNDRIIRTDLYTLDLSTPGERMKALVPCWRIAGLLPLLADRCFNLANGNNCKLFPYSDFERYDMGNGNFTEMTPNAVTRYFSNKRKWAEAKEIYDFLDCRIPHAEVIMRSSEKEMAITFKPRGCKFKPCNCDQLVEALKHVTKALVALHDLSFMHRDLCWEKVMRRSEREGGEWFVAGFEEAVRAPQIYPHAAASGRHAPEMGRGLHSVKVDVWGVGYLLKTSGLTAVPKMLWELQNRCLDHNPEQRPTAADCYHHLLQLQSAAGGGGY